MNLSISGLLAGFIFGVIGFYLFREGKRRINHKVLIIGLVMMIYTYFTKSPIADWGIGIVLSGLGYYFWE